MSPPQAKKHTILFINPWAGPLGPNFVLEKVAGECLRRGHRVVIAAREADEILVGLQERGAEAHIIPHLELTKRTRRLGPLLAHLWHSRRAMRQAADVCRQVGAEAVVVNSEIMLLAPKAGTLAGRRSIVVIHGARFNEMGFISRLFYGLQKRWVWRYLAVSHTVADLMVNLGVPAANVAVVYNGVDGQKFQPGPRRPGLRKELGIAADAPLFGDVSHLEPRKGAHHLVEVLARVRREIPGACCLVVGEMERYGHQQFVRQVRQRAQELGVADGFILTGNRPDVPDILRELDLMVHPSETESFGLVIAEAMASGLPVIGFNAGAVGEVIDDGRTGRTIVPFDVAMMADATIGMLKDPGLRSRMGQAGREKVLREYDLKRSLDAMVDLLERSCTTGTDDGE
jgi:glycosyltransferase involved in cell wall biosynthesis